MIANERRKIADIVESFGKINQDIHKAFNVMSDFLNRQNKYYKWKKSQDRGYYDFLGLTKGQNNWYYLNFYGEYRKKIVGFTFVIGVGIDSDYDDYFYLKFIQSLDKEINPRIPMLSINGIYTPAGDINKSRIVDEHGWNYVDEVLRITEGWKNFSKDTIAYDRWLNIEIEYDDVDDDYLEKTGWYKSAKVKILPITYIDSEERAEELIRDLMQKADSY